MANQLCTEEAPGCIGFPISDETCPYALVKCRDGELVTEGWTAAQGSIVGAGETVNVVMATTSVYNSSILELTGTNPWCTNALIWVSHEFGATIEVSDTDEWSINGDINISGGTLLSGGTTGQFTLLGRDGTAFANSDTLPIIIHQQAFAMIYVVAANTAFTIQQLTRVEALTIGGGIGGGREVVGFSNAMKAILLPREG